MRGFIRLTKAFDSKPVWIVPEAIIAVTISDSHTCVYFGAGEYDHWVVSESPEYVMEAVAIRLQRGQGR